MKKVVQDLTSGGIDWQREKWQSGLGSKFIHQGEKNAVKYADEVIVLSKGVQDYFKETYGRHEFWASYEPASDNSGGKFPRFLPPACCSMDSPCQELHQGVHLQDE